MKLLIRIKAPTLSKSLDSFRSSVDVKRSTKKLVYSLTAKEMHNLIKVFENDTS